MTRSVDRLVANRHFGILVTYLRDDDKVYGTYQPRESGTPAQDGTSAADELTNQGYARADDPLVMLSRTTTYQIMVGPPAAESASNGAGRNGTFTRGIASRRRV